MLSSAERPIRPRCLQAPFVWAPEVCHLVILLDENQRHCLRKSKIRKARPIRKR